MFEKNMSIGILLDFYGEILNERRRGVLDMYYNEDLSLSEISEVIGISRQGVRDMIKKSENELLFYEEKLGLAKRFKDIQGSAEKIYSMSDSVNIPEELKTEIKHLADIAQ